MKNKNVRTKIQYEINDILACEEFRRLENISFLGIIDFYNIHENNGKTKRYSRAEHTLGVYDLTLAFCEQADLDEEDCLTALTTALCHDMGHLALSHTSEHITRILDNKINHKSQTYSIIMERSGNIRRIIEAMGVNPRRVAELASSSEDDKLNFIFHCPINLDTLDGMARFAWSMGFSPPFYAENITSYLLKLFNSQELSFAEAAEIDNFWLVKKFFYEDFLVKGFYAEYERQFVEFSASRLGNKISELSAWSEEKLIENVGWNFSDFKRPQNNSRRERPAWKFSVNKDVNLTSISDLQLRYKRTRNAEL